MSAVRVLIGLRDRLISDAFDLLLGEAGFVVTTCSSDPVVVVDRALRDDVDLVLVGSDVIEDDGASPLLDRLAAVVPSAHVVVLLRAHDDVAVRWVVRYAVRGVIPAGVGTAECLGILQQVLDGNVVYPCGLLTRLAEPRAPELLSDRQREVLEQLALGRSNDEIAQRLFISRNTVKFHLREIYTRLGVHNRVEAARAGREALALGDGRSHPGGWGEPPRETVRQPPV